MAASVTASLIFLSSLFLIFTERLNRTIAAIAGSVAMVGFGLVLHFYSEEAAIEAIDFNTLGLLLGMMILVALLEPTGFFQYLAVWTGRFSKGSPPRLFFMLAAITTILSMFLDNVTTVVLIAPISILISEILGISAIPLLMAEALLSNTGGVATLVGDPPNVAIGSAAGLTFNDFLLNSLPIVSIVWIIALVFLYLVFRADLQGGALSPEAVLQLNPDEALNDRKTARRVLIVLGIAIIMFFLHGALHLSPSFVALGSAALALVWVRPDLNKTLQHIEWSVLIFFTSLFIMVGGLESAGVLHNLALLLGHVSHIPPVAFGVILIWVVAIASAIVDNVPITIAMIPVIIELGAAGINIQPLWWALAFGAGFGGNGTIIGSSANIVVASLSERTRTPITASLWSRRGLPLMIITCVMASVLYILLFPYLST